MTLRICLSLILSFFLYANMLSAEDDCYECCCECCENCECCYEDEGTCLDFSRYWDKLCDGNIIYIGPEIYHTKRMKKGGTEQKGVLYGIRAGFDHIKRYHIYVGLEGNFATGEIKGHTGRGTSIKSHLTDSEIEVRGGYTIASKNDYIPSFTPFIGYGYFCQYNHFKNPSPIHLEFRDTFSYVVTGFLSQVSLTSYLDLGLVFKAKFMWNGQSRVTNDPDFEDRTLRMDSRTQYSVDLPITYNFCFCDHSLAASLVPFYQFRHYGGFESFPFDFVETKFVNYGARLLLGYCF